MTTTTTKKIKITMSERRPLTIVDDEWPVIAEAHDYNGQHECQANRVWRIKVREHTDGRRIVYGFLQGGPGGMHPHEREVYGGFLIDVCDANHRNAGKPDEDKTIRAIRRVAGIIDHDKLGNECIADLPAEELG